MAGLAAFTGVQVAPILRRSVVEELILLGALGVALTTALLAAMTGG